jgi:hypothetical protein
MGKTTMYGDGRFCDPYPPKLRRRKDGSLECMLHPSVELCYRFGKYHPYCPVCYAPKQQKREFVMSRTRAAREQPKEEEIK